MTIWKTARRRRRRRRRRRLQHWPPRAISSTTILMTLKMLTFRPVPLLLLRLPILPTALCHRTLRRWLSLLPSLRVPSSRPSRITKIPVRQLMSLKKMLQWQSDRSRRSPWKKKKKKKKKKKSCPRRRRSCSRFSCRSRRHKSRLLQQRRGLGLREGRGGRRNGGGL